MHLRVLPYRKVSPANIGFRFVVLTECASILSPFAQITTLFANISASGALSLYLKPFVSILLSNRGAENMARFDKG